MRIEEFCINFLSLFIRREYVLKALQKLFNEKGFIGMLPDGNLLLYPLDDFKLLPIIYEIYHKKIYDVGQTENFNFICDIGAHIGLFTLRASKLAPNSKIIAIEPHPANFHFLIKNILINELESRVHASNIAAGKEKGKTIFYLSRLSRGDSSSVREFVTRNDDHMVIDTLPLDDVLPIDKFCDLLKIDVEGAETEILKGLKRKCARVNRIIMEVHLLAFPLADTCELLRNSGFIITKTQKLYENCLLLEAQRPFSVDRGGDKAC